MYGDLLIVDDDPFIRKLVTTTLRDVRAKPAQNYRIDHPEKPKRPLWKSLLGRPERHYHPSVGYYEHMPAWRVRTYVG